MVFALCLLNYLAGGATASLIWRTYYRARYLKHLRKAHDGYQALADAQHRATIALLERQQRAREHVRTPTPTPKPRPN